MDAKKKEEEEEAEFIQTLNKGVLGNGYSHLRSGCSVPGFRDMTHIRHMGAFPSRILVFWGRTSSSGTIEKTVSVGLT